jgi:hypothetical protein
LARDGQNRKIAQKSRNRRRAGAKGRGATNEKRREKPPLLWHELAPLIKPAADSNIDSRTLFSLIF